MDLDMVAPTLAEDDMEKTHSEVNNRLNTLLDVMAKLIVVIAVWGKYLWNAYIVGY